MTEVLSVDLSWLPYAIGGILGGAMAVVTILMLVNGR
jgi:hypothetical protein